MFRTTTAALALGLMLATPALAQKEDYLKQVDLAAGHKVVAGKTVKFETSKGNFTMVLFPKEAPATVANFEKLIRKGFYDGLSFHRVVPGFVAQGGDPAGNGTGGPGWSIPDELNSSLKHLRGSVAMAKSSAPNSAGSQFYICFAPISHLDGKYTVFGQVVTGMDVVDKLTPVGPEVPNPGKPDKMLKVRLQK